MYDAVEAEGIEIATELENRGYHVGVDGVEKINSVVSSHEAEAKDIKKDMQKENILHISEKLFPSSEWSLTEAPQDAEGPDLVPTSNNASSDGKGTEKDGNTQNNNDGRRMSVGEVRKADSEQEIPLLQQYMEKRGIPIVYTGDFKLADGSEAPGYIDMDGVVHINPNKDVCADPLAATIGHELMHSTEGLTRFFDLTSDEYESFLSSLRRSRGFMEWVREKLGEDAGRELYNKWENATDKKKREALEDELRDRLIDWQWYRYRSLVNSNFTRDQAERELFADYIGAKLLTDDAFLNRLIEGKSAKQTKAATSIWKKIGGFFRSLAGQTQYEDKATEFNRLADGFERAAERNDLRLKYTEGLRQMFGGTADATDRYKVDIEKNLAESEKIANLAPEEVVDKIGKAFYDDNPREDRLEVVKYLQSSEKGKVALARIHRLQDTPWAKAAAAGAAIQIALEDLAAGREPRVGSMMTRLKKDGTDEFKKFREDFKSRGIDAIYDRYRKLGIMSGSTKPVNSVNGSFLSCNPSDGCAQFCYAAGGHQGSKNPVVKSELIYWAAKNDPIGLAERILAEYKLTPEFYSGKALRFFDMGDLDETWIPIIKHLNNNGVVTQIFSKNGNVLREIDKSWNVVCLSIDSSNAYLLDQYKELPVAFVYTGEQDLPLLEKCKDRFEKWGGTVLPVKGDNGYMSQEEIRKLPSWTIKYQCPIDNGKLEIGDGIGKKNVVVKDENGKTVYELDENGKPKEGADGKKIKKTEARSTWNCTLCDAQKGIGRGCFVHRPSNRLTKLDDDIRRELQRNGLSVLDRLNSLAVKARNEGRSLTSVEAASFAKELMESGDVRGTVSEFLAEINEAKGNELADVGDGAVEKLLERYTRWMASRAVAENTKRDARPAGSGTLTAEGDFRPDSGGRGPQRDSGGLGLADGTSALDAGSRQSVGAVDAARDVRDMDDETFKRYYIGKNARVRDERRKAVGRAVAEVAREAGIDVVMDKDEMQRALNENLSEIWQDLTTPSEEVFALSPKDTAKLNEIKKNLKSIEEKYKRKNTKHGILTDLSQAFGAEGKEVSKYVSLKLPNGNEVLLRFSNHNANADKYAERGESEGNISIIFKSKKSKNTFRANDDVVLTEYVYTSEDIAKDGNMLSQVAQSLGKMLDTGVYEDLTGKALVNEYPAEVLQKMTVWHGSPYAFEAFDHSKMGTGEGAQAHGWGTYVAKDKGVGEMYAQGLGKGSVLAYKGIPYYALPAEERDFIEVFFDGYTDGGRTAKELQSVLDESIEYYKENRSSYIDDLLDIAKSFDVNDLGTYYRRNLYAVSIPDDNGKNYLKEGKPIGRKVANKLTKILLQEGWDVEKFGNDDYVANQFSRKDDSNRSIYIDEGDDARDIAGSKDGAELLYKAGYVGIKYDGRQDGECYVIFNEADAKIVNHTQFLKTSKGEVYGFVKDGKIYLDPEKINPNTPIHEYSHLWDNVLKVNNPELWARWKDLVRGSDEWKKVVNDKAYADIAGDEDAVASEVKARLCGQKGKERLQQMEDEAFNEPDIVERAKKISFIARVKELLRSMWEATKQWFANSNIFRDKFTKQQIESLTVDDFVNKTLDDLARGVNPMEYAGKAEGEMGISVIRDNDAVVDATKRNTPQSTKPRKVKDNMKDASPMIPGLFDDLGDKPTEADRQRVDKELSMDEIYNTIEQRMAEIEGELADAESRLIDIKDEQTYNDSLVLRAERASLEQDIEDLYDEYSGLQEYNGMARMVRLYDIVKLRQDVQAESDAQTAKTENAEATEEESLTAEVDTNVQEPLFLTRKLKDGEKCYVERQFEEYKQFNFTGKKKIESVDDIAYIFKELEDAAVENSFAVLVKDGRPTIVHLGVGMFNATQVNVPALKVAYERVQPDKVYFVHNHPSGALKASNQDYAVARDIAKALNLSEEQFINIIIDTKSGKYGIFNPLTMDSQTRTRNADTAGETLPLKVYSFSKQVFDKDYNPDREQLTNAGAIAAFISSQRLGERDKVNVLVFNNQLQITANLFTKLKTIPKSDKALLSLASKVAADAITFGGNQVVFYGDGVKGTKDRLVKLEQLMKAVQVRMVDAIEIKDNGGYNSYYNDEIAEGAAEYDPTESAELITEFISELSKKHKTDVFLANNYQSLNNEQQKMIDKAHAEGRRIPGWYDIRSGRVVFYLPDVINRSGAEKTFLHEVVGHKGLRAILGKEFDKVCRLVYNSLDPDTRRQLINKYGDNTNVIADEYMASMAEGDVVKPSLWGRIVSRVKQLLRNVGFNVNMSDNDIRILLWRSKNRLTGKQAADAKIKLRYNTFMSKVKSIFAENIEKNEEGRKGAFEEGQDKLGQERPRAEMDNDGRVFEYVPARIMASEALGDIAVFEEALDAEHRKSDGMYPRLERREEEEKGKEALRQVARQTGKFLEGIYVHSLGVLSPKLSSESDVYIDENNGVVYKVKDPFYNIDIKGNSPYDVIYEHVAHNVLFPTTSYKFKGITERNGQPALLLSQEFIPEGEKATDAEVEAYMAQLGLKKNGLFFENEDVSVTDVWGDNVRKGANGELYFIDPMIHFKKPAKEAIGHLASQIDNIENVRQLAYNQMLDTNTETENDDVVYRLREADAPKNTGIGYKVFVLKNGKLYPPMVANPCGEATPVGVWLDADAAPVASQSKTGRPQVKAGGKGTQGGSGVLAYRPGWHLGEIPYAIQFNRLNPTTGEKELFPANFVWAEAEYANDVDYQKER